MPTDACLGEEKIAGSRAMLDVTVAGGGGRVRVHLVRALLDHGQARNLAPRSQVRYANRKTSTFCAIRLDLMENGGARAKRAQSGNIPLSETRNLGVTEIR